MAVKSCVLVVFLTVCFVWGSSASQDEGKRTCPAVFLCVRFLPKKCANFVIYENFVTNEIEPLYLRVIDINSRMK